MIHFVLLVYLCLDLSLIYESDATNFPLSFFPVSSADCEPLLEIWARDGLPSAKSTKTNKIWVALDFVAVVLQHHSNYIHITSLNSVLAAKTQLYKS